MVKGQFSRGNMSSAVVADPGRNAVTPPLGTAQFTGFIPFAAKLLFGDIAKEIHDRQDTEFGIRNTGENPGFQPEYRQPKAT
jgi:hypothetical protein